MFMGADLVITIHDHDDGIQDQAVLANNVGYTYIHIAGNYVMPRDETLSSIAIASKYDL